MLTIICRMPMATGFTLIAGLKVPYMISTHWMAKASHTRPGMIPARLSPAVSSRLKVP